MKKPMVFLLIAVVIGFSGIAFSTTIVDFENTGLNEGDLLTNQILGLTFSGAAIAEEGYPEFAFSDGDQATGGVRSAVIS